MTQSIKTNQKVTGGFDLDSFVSAGAEPAPPQSAPEKPRKPVEKKKAAKSKAPPKKQPLYATERIQLRLTQEELETVKKQADGRKLGPFIRKFLIDQGLI